MELIPILSTIILVATISTFLLAIGAYILYKARERKGRVASIAQPTEVKAELVTPAAASVLQQQRMSPQPIIVEREPIIIQQQAQTPQQQRVNPRPQPFTVYRQPINVNIQQPRQYTETGYVQQRGYQGQQTGASMTEGRQSRESKFMKYTSEGYVPAKEDKDIGAVKWR
jgi:hypothetical protein